MVRLRFVPWCLIVLVLSGARPLLAAPINLNLPGLADKDSTRSTNPGVQTPPVIGSRMNVGEVSFTPANGWVSGWAVQDIRTYYNPVNDTLYVGLNTFKNAAGQAAIF